jgi:excisionase family DNA binding protein
MCDISERLDRIESRIAELVAMIRDQRAVKDWYTTVEAAERLGKSDYTVREWARCGRINAGKRATGHGRSKEWIISDAELTRISNEGLLPMPSRT